MHKISPYLAARGQRFQLSNQSLLWVQVSELTREVSSLREALAEARGKLSGADALVQEASAANRKMALMENQLEGLKEALGDSRAEANMLRARVDESEAENKTVRLHWTTLVLQRCALPAARAVRVSSRAGPSLAWPRCMALLHPRHAPSCFLRGSPVFLAGCCCLTATLQRVQCAVSAVEQMQSLQSEYEDTCSQLKLAQQQCRQLQGELDVERINASSKNDAAEFYHSLIQNIQAQIQGASRPGSASESQADGMSQEASAAVIGAVRQSIGAPAALIPMQSAMPSAPCCSCLPASDHCLVVLTLPSQLILALRCELCCFAMAPAV